MEHFDFAMNLSLTVRIIHLGLVILLDCDNLARLFLYTLSHYSVGTLTQHLAILVILYFRLIKSGKQESWLLLLALDNHWNGLRQ